MIAPDNIIQVPIVDLKRRFAFMLQQEGGEFKDLFGRFNSLAEILDFSFDKLPIFFRLKETIRYNTVHDLKTVEHYFRHVVFNHTVHEQFQPVDFELVLFFNSQLVKYIRERFPKDYIFIQEAIAKDLKHVFWFPKEVPFWVKEEYETLEVEAQAV